MMKIKSLFAGKGENSKREDGLVSSFPELPLTAKREGLEGSRCHLPGKAGLGKSQCRAGGASVMNRPGRQPWGSQMSTFGRAINP